MAGKRTVQVGKWVASVACVGTAVLLGACGSHGPDTKGSSFDDIDKMCPMDPSPGDNYVLIKVRFDDDNCPVETALPCAVLGERRNAGQGVRTIRWMAVRDFNDSTALQNIPYRVVFDPFPSGKPLKPRPPHSGVIDSMPLVDNDFADPGRGVIYKYSVYTESGACRDKPLDPLIRVY